MNQTDEHPQAPEGSLRAALQTLPDVRRKVTLAIDQGIYPFGDENGGSMRRWLH